MVHDFSIHLDLDPQSENFRILAKCALVGDGEGSLALSALKSLYDEQTGLATPRGADATRTEGVEAGRALFEAIMGTNVRELFQRATQEAWERGHRLRLILESSGPAGLPTWVHALLWELMYDPERDRFLAIDPDVLLVRYLRQPRPIGTFPTMAPLTVLTTSACPKDKTIPSLALDREMDRLEHLFRWPQMRDRVRVTPRRDIRFSELRGVLNRARRADPAQPFRIWHHCGHGRFHKESNEYQLAFEKDLAQEAWIGAGSLADLLGECKELCLVFLNVCLGACPNGLGAMLAGLGVPAVIGHSVSVEDRVALQFSQEFWRAFATLPVDAAVQRARQLLAGSHKPLAFAHAVVFLRSLDSLSVPAPQDSVSESELF